MRVIRKYIYILVLLILPITSAASNSHVELKEGCYKSSSLKDKKILSDVDYKLFDKVSCNNPHHIEIFHKQRFVKQPLEENIVQDVCVTYSKTLFKENISIPNLRWFLTYDNEHEEYDPTVLCYLVESDLEGNIAVESKLASFFKVLGIEIKKYAKLNIQEQSQYINDERLISETFRILPWNKNILAFIRAYRHGVHEEGGWRNILIITGRYNLNLKEIQSLNVIDLNEDDSVKFEADDLSVDTGLYILNTQKRAIGFKIDSSHESWPGWEGDARNELLLYDDSSEFSKVLHMYMQNYMWSSNGFLGMQYKGSRADLTLTMGVNKTNGLHDAIIQARIYHWDNSDIADCADYLEWLKEIAAINKISQKEIELCSEDLAKSGKYPYYTNEHFVLHFDGNKYVAQTRAPWWLKIVDQ